MHAEIVVPRISRDENKVAIIQFRVTPTVDEKSLLLGVRRAVAEWTTQTEKGRSVLDSLRGNFNVSDLAGWLEDRGLRDCLARQGVEELEVEVHSDDRPVDWEFRDNLATA